MQPCSESGLALGLVYPFAHDDVRNLEYRLCTRGLVIQFPFSMPSLSTATGLTITNPLVLYRALLATKQIEPDPSQHRLAIHLQKLYIRLKDYNPEIDYSRRLNQISCAVGKPPVSPAKVEINRKDSQRKNVKSIFTKFRAQNPETDALGLTKTLTNHESAVKLKSPQGLLLYGEVGTGKSMLVDLLADCLPTHKKRRWHFNTFMLETFARLEQLRRKRLDWMTAGSPGIFQDEEYSLLRLAREMVSTSPILFLDEFQLPDRVASKILSNLFTSFFQLGGVLIATSNRMPEELAKASGIHFVAPTSPLGLFGNRWGLLGSGSAGGKIEDRFSGKGDFAAFLEVLRARCEIWDIEGGKDWRRREAEEEQDVKLKANRAEIGRECEAGCEDLEPVVPLNLELGCEQGKGGQNEANFIKPGNANAILPKNYFVMPSSVNPGNTAKVLEQAWDTALLCAICTKPSQFTTSGDIPWEKTSLRVYGRELIIPRHLSGVTIWSFSELCSTNLGPADYISLASTFHTLILVEVPTLTLLHKNEARRLITLLDALYEARCKLLVRAEAGPDSIFFPETQQPRHDTELRRNSSQSLSDEIYPETFSEIYQDQTSPFRLNISPYIPSASPPTYSSPPLPSFTASAHPSTRSILADEDSDFGPVYGAGRSQSPSPSSLPGGPSDGIPGAGNEIGRQQDGLNFARTGAFTGEDERFAYKRARSRLWEMCGARWWAREEGWWRPVAKEVRRWEGSLNDDRGSVAVPGDTPSQDVQRKPESEQTEEEGPFRHGASPFRVSAEAPPRFTGVHAWGMVRWGRKAGLWGKGVEGLGERKGVEDEGREREGGEGDVEGKKG